MDLITYALCKGSGGGGGGTDHGIPSGGTTGQVLKKASGTDYDATWGDDNGIPAPANPSTGAFLVWNGSAWVAQTLSTWEGGNY